MLEMQPLVDLSLFSLTKVANIQQSSCKNRRDAYLPLCGHMQAPDFDDGKE